MVAWLHVRGLWELVLVYGVGSVALSSLDLLFKAPDSHLLLGSAHRDAARPQECAHYRELDDCPECDSGGGAGVLSI